MTSSAILLPSILVIMTVLACTGVSNTGAGSGGAQSTPTQSGSSGITIGTEPAASNSSSPTDQGTGNQTQQGPPPTTQQPDLTANLTAEQKELWNALTVENVQAVCVAKAKEKAGSLAWGIKACYCSETSTPDGKKFACDIDTVAMLGTGNYVDADCSLAAKKCDFDSNFGTDSITFDQMYAIYKNG